MNKSFEKILERLEETDFSDIQMTVREVLLKYGFPYESVVQDEVWDALDELSTNKIAIKIVQEVAEEYSGGWIPCSEKLPELRQGVLVTVKYTGFMGMHGYWIKTGHMEAENDWWGDCAGGEVIAWQPLPEQYKERD